MNDVLKNFDTRQAHHIPMAFRDIVAHMASNFQKVENSGPMITINTDPVAPVFGGVPVISLGDVLADQNLSKDQCSALADDLALKLHLGKHWDLTTTTKITISTTTTTTTKYVDPDRCSRNLNMVYVIDHDLMSLYADFIKKFLLALGENQLIGWEHTPCKSFSRKFFLKQNRNEQVSSYCIHF